MSRTRTYNIAIYAVPMDWVPGIRWTVVLDLDPNLLKPEVVRDREALAQLSRMSVLTSKNWIGPHKPLFTGMFIANDDAGIYFVVVRDGWTCVPITISLDKVLQHVITEYFKSRPQPL
jgi:hypothetical protein